MLYVRHCFLDGQFCRCVVWRFRIYLGRRGTLFAHEMRVLEHRLSGAVHVKWFLALNGDRFALRVVI